jgi:hypothetical protein
MGGKGEGCGRELVRRGRKKLLGREHWILAQEKEGE